MNYIETVSPSRTYIAIIAKPGYGYEFEQFELPEPYTNNSSIASNIFFSQQLDSTKPILGQELSGLPILIVAIEQFNVKNLPTASSTDLYFQSESHRIIYALVELNGGEKFNKLGVGKLHFQDIEIAKSWYDSLDAQLKHSDHPNAEKAQSELIRTFAQITGSTPEMALQALNLMEAIADTDAAIADLKQGNSLQDWHITPLEEMGLNPETVWLSLPNQKTEEYIVPQFPQESGVKNAAYLLAKGKRRIWLVRTLQDPTKLFPISAYTLKSTTIRRIEYFTDANGQLEAIASDA